ncbi:DUF3445 domain-containing protein [Nitriliruptoraceae bacterium ZYF776]|nr:DUF3445 domain-containing protein [Profundirhabdus halotolerans]
MTLPRPVVPFAVRDGAAVRPDLVPLDRPPPPPVEDDGPRTLLRIDADLPRLLANKQDVVARAADRAVATADDVPAAWLTAAGHRLAEVCGGAVPGLVRHRAGAVELPAAGVRVDDRGHLGQVPPSSPLPAADRATLVARLHGLPEHRRALEAVALAVGEDLVLVGTDGRARWLHVCAPSGWAPGEAGGAPLTALHGPIPTGDRLRRASTNLAAAITRRGPFVRWTWGFDGVDRLARQPDDPPIRWPDDPGRWWWRAERQTTVPLRGLDAGLFTIRVHLALLADVVDATRARRLAGVVAALPQDLAAYKGLAGRRDRLLAWLDARAGSGSASPIGR